MFPWYLEEVLAGDDECQLGTEIFCLGLAPSDPLDQLRDVISHRLQEARKMKTEHTQDGDVPKRGVWGNAPSDNVLWMCLPSWGCPAQTLDSLSSFSPLGPCQH